MTEVELKWAQVEKESADPVLWRVLALTGKEWDLLSHGPQIKLISDL